MSEYSKTYEISWSDLDANGHVNYAAYIDAAGDVRYKFFIEHDFPPGKFTELGIGPVYLAIHAQFFREVRMSETVTITYSMSGLSPSGARWKVHHEILKSSGKKAVTLDLEGAILDLSARRPVPPAPELLQVFHLIPRSDNFEVLPEIRRMK